VALPLCGCEIWCVTLGEEHVLGCSGKEHRGLRGWKCKRVEKILDVGWPKGEEV
jgi:hypothetical protein